VCGLQALEQKLALSEADRALLYQEINIMARTFEQHGINDPRVRDVSLKKHLPSSLFSSTKGPKASSVTKQKGFRTFLITSPHSK
jgi:hypothetical protein